MSTTTANMPAGIGTAAVAALRNHLLAALATLPGARTFHLHTLVSAPHKHSALFPYAHPRPRVYFQDILLLLSESPAAPDGPTTAPERVLVTAIELSLYTLPSTSSAVLYVSKVDTTGQGAHPSPTRTLVTALLAYYVDPRTRPPAPVPVSAPVDTLWVQLFARAQGQYLFPNSAEYAGKRPLGDVKLCVWWKGVVGEVADAVGAQGARDGSEGVRGECKGERGGGGGGGEGVKMGLWYVLPGFSELEAMANLHISSTAAAAPQRPNGKGTSSAHAQWTYGHHYSQTDIRLPCPPPKGVHHLGHYIPWFDDDPKARFIDEIAHTTEGDMAKSPERKRTRVGLQRTASNSTVDLSTTTTTATTEGKEKETVDRDKDERPRHHHDGELGKVTPDEFWERMSFRQECIAGAVTGFFSLGVTSAHASPSTATTATTITGTTTTTTDAHKPALALAPQPGQVAPRLVKRVVSSLMNGYDFSTRENAVRATETLEGVIRGLCENVVAPPPLPLPPPTSVDTADVEAKAPLLFRRGAKTPEPPSGQGPATLQVPRTPTRPRASSISGSKAPGLEDVSPNPFPEPVASVETYETHIYGTVTVRNAPLPSSGGAGEGEGGLGGAGHGGGGDDARAMDVAQQVTVLAVRKKKRKLEP